MRATLEKLLDKYKKGQITEEELAFLHAYYEQLEAEQKGLSELNEDDLLSLHNEIKGAVDISIDADSTGTVPGQMLLRRKWLPAAAAVLLVMATGWWLLHRPAPRHELPVVAASSNQLIIAAEREYLRLPDSSLVILEAGSRLEYPVSFADHQPRVIRLTGAAFFDVTHREGSSFQVKSDKLNITVLGTAFHIRAWPDEKDNSVIVTRGKVKVEADQTLLGYLAPAEKIRFDKLKSSPFRSVIKPGTENPEPEELTLDNVSLEEALQLVEKLYAVQLHIDAPLSSPVRFSGTIIKGETLKEVMDRIARFNKIDYTINEAGDSLWIEKK
ncbi:MAG: FecR family protein [Flavihumibacter sp.]